MKLSQYLNRKKDGHLPKVTDEFFVNRFFSIRDKEEEGKEEEEQDCLNNICI